MKRKICICIFLFIRFTQSEAQKIKAEDIPVTVIHAFDSLFPFATDISHRIDSNKNFVFSFSSQQRKCSALLNERGQLKVFRKTIPFNHIPKEVVAELNKIRSDYKIIRADSIVSRHFIVIFREGQKPDLIENQRSVFLEVTIRKKMQNEILKYFFTTNSFMLKE